MSESLVEIDFSIRAIEWFAEEARRIYGDTIQSSSEPLSSFLYL
jgi:acyl-CoA reductase-like NAD-dependent aldehyde dehydrogenase